MAVGKDPFKRMQEVAGKINKVGKKTLLTQLRKPATLGFIAQQNRDQLLASEKSNNASITPLYSPSYARVKGTDKPNLKSTGAFHKGIKAKVTAKATTIVSTDSKTEKLTKKYSEEIIGLQTGKIPLIVRYISTGFAKGYEKEMTKGF